MPQIFALQGAARSGKSSTLIELLNQISLKYPSATIQKFHSGRDVKVIINPVQGLIIGIESQGDPNSRLKQTLNDFMIAKCDIIFCACRTSGMTVKWINSMSPPYSVQFIRQTWTQTNQNAANFSMATHLMQIAGI